MGRPKYILLVRHGESEGNCDKSVNRHTPNHKICLTEQGHSEAKKAGIVLKDFLCQLEKANPDSKNPRSVLFYTSPYLRARQTCKGIIDGIRDVPGVEFSVSEEARMREQDFGNFQSTAEEAEKIWEQRAHYGHFFYRIPFGESAADVYDRVASFNESLFRQFQADDFPNVLVLVTHGIWARVFLMKWFRWSYEQFESLRNIPHCQYLVMKRAKNDKFKLKTPLRTWDDLPDSAVEGEVAREFTQEVTFNTQGNLHDPEDLDIANILKAQEVAIKENRKKDQELKIAYEQSKNKFTACHKFDRECARSREDLHVVSDSDESQ